MGKGRTEKKVGRVSSVKAAILQTSARDGPALAIHACNPRADRLSDTTGLASEEVLLKPAPAPVGAAGQIGAAV